MKIMKIRALSAVFFLLIISLPAGAEELTMVPSVGYGFSSFHFLSSTGRDDRARFSIVDFALTAAYARFYVRVNAEVPMGQEITTSGTDIRQFQREDYSVAAGYGVLDNLSIFGGFSSGKTSIITYTAASTVYTRHTDNGPFIGASYNYDVGDNASIGLSLAYAFMNGSYSRFVAGTGLTDDESGNTSGLSMGITWSDSYRDKATYYLSYKYKSYNSVLETRSIGKIFNIFTFGFIFPI